MEPTEEEEEELRDEQQSPVKMEKEEGEEDGVGKRVNHQTVLNTHHSST